MKTFRFLGFALVAILLCLSACSKGGEDEPIAPTPKPEVNNPTITLDSSIQASGLSFDMSASEKSISFTTTSDWTLSIAETRSGTEWCTASPTSGGKGTANVKFTTIENTEPDDRSVAVTIKAGATSKTFTVTQKGKDALLVTTKKYELPKEGGEIEIEVKANVDYQMTIAESAKEWITEATGRALTTHKHILKIAPSEEAVKREGEITFKSGDMVETVKVYQAGEAVLLLSKNEFTVSDAGETISVDLQSNVEYGVQMPNVDWIQAEEASRAMSSHTLKYIVATNETYDNREALIIFYDKNNSLKDTLKITQVQKDAIVLSKKEYNVEAEGATIEVKVASNVDFEIQIPSDVTWITKVDSRALTEKIVYLKIAENTTVDSRNAEISFTNKDSQISENITINQYGAVEAGYTDGIVTLAKAGTMAQLLGDNLLNITSLKVVGPINGDDVRCLRQMLGGHEFGDDEKGKLTSVDLSEASIVRGGEMYLYYTYSYYASDNVIGNYMFYKCINLQNLILPANIISISRDAFRDCSSLTSIEIPEGVSSVDSEVFRDCSSLTSIEIPEGVTSIKSAAFYGCSSLTSIKIPESVTSIEGDVFYGCTSLTSIEIPNNITKIGQYTFCDCSSLSSIEIHDGITSIENSAFRNCSSLTSVTLGTSVTTIGSYVFSGCTSLTSIDIPEGVNLIGSSAFSGCTSLTSIKIPAAATTISDYAFSGCSSLNSIEIPAGVTSIGRSAFYESSFLKSVHITDLSAWCNITFSNDSSNPLQYGATLYLNNKELTELIIPEEITEIKKYAFKGCTSITSLTMGEGVTSINEGAFYNCSSLTSVAIGTGVTEIGSQTFYGCSSLTSVNIPDGITEINWSTFLNCSSLASIDIPNSVTKIGLSAFYGCSSLISINIPNSVTTIESSAFISCSSLSSIQIPASVTKIGERAFSCCYSLESVHITDLSAWCNITFSESDSHPLNYNGGKLYLNNNELTELVIPTDIKKINDYTFYGCNGITKVTIGEGVASVGVQSFNNCSSLTQVYCHATTPPTINLSTTNSSFNGSIDGKTLYVPVGYSSAYQSSNWAKFFKTIEEMK